MTLLPVFPLEAVVFPGMTVPLNVFEERYKRLVRHCLEAEDHRFIITLDRSSSSIVDGGPRLHSVGTLMDILTVEEQGDGTFILLVHGQGRCRIEVDHEEAVIEPDGSLRPLWFARSTEWPLERGDPNEERIAAWDALETFRSYADHFFAAEAQRRVEKAIPDDLLFQASFLCANVRVPLESRQVILEVPSLAGRFHLIRRRMEELLPADGAFNGDEEGPNDAGTGQSIPSEP